MRGNDETTVRYTADELAAMRQRSECRSDWVRVAALTEEELEASVDFEEEGCPNLDTLQVGLPSPSNR